MQVPKSTRKEIVYRNPSACKPYKGNPARDFEFQVKQCSRQRLDGWIRKESFQNFHLVCTCVLFFYSGVFSSFHAYSLIALVFVPWSKLPIIYKRRLVLHFDHLGQPDGVRPNRSILVVTLVYKLDTLLASLE